MSGIDALSRETMLFAAVGFLIGGLDDLALDLVYFGQRAWRRLRGTPAACSASLDDYAARDHPGRIAIFVAAWDEANVIGAMLRAALATIDHPDYLLYVGTYPNDPATIRAVADVAAEDQRVRLVIGARDGPTTKADCLNACWGALLREEAGGAPSAMAIVLHDAEDVIHPGELRVIAALTADYWAVQVPVLPLRAPGSPLISGHYLEEFAEAHTKQLVVRQALGAGMPLAGVGCGLARVAIDAIAMENGGAPFDAASLTEDYEMGLRITERGGRSILARVTDPADGSLVAVRAYFPATLWAAVRQRTRWMIGISLSGWDRVGWARWHDIGDHWMRMRDRRALIAMIVLAIAYLALLLWGIAMAAHTATRISAPPVPGWTVLLLRINAALLVWRLAMRFVFTRHAYGWAEALWSLPRALVANIIALMAARRAASRYVAMLRGAAPVWDKTVHLFPAQPADRR